MADKDQDQYQDQYNDEYQFDLDMEGSEPVEGEESYGEPTSNDTRPSLPGSNVKRNALIVIFIVILAMVVYKFLGSVLSGKKETDEVTASQVQSPQPTQSQLQPQSQPQPQPQPQPEMQQPTEQPSESATTTPVPQVQQRLSTMETSQQNLRSDVTTVSNQINTIGTNINEMTSQIAELQQTITSLSNKIDEQSQDIIRLRAAAKSKPDLKVVKRVVKPVTKYFVQALIPGRAWLISSKGSTLTVREGSTIPDYGTVKLIDPHQGRIITSSGKIIRFSQNDS